MMNVVRKVSALQTRATTKRNVLASLDANLIQGRGHWRGHGDFTTLFGGVLGQRVGQRAKLSVFSCEISL